MHNYVSFLYKLIVVTMDILPDNRQTDHTHCVGHLYEPAVAHTIDDHIANSNVELHTLALVYYQWLYSAHQHYFDYVNLTG